MRSFRSSYFVYPDTRWYVDYEADECKICGKTRIRKMTPDWVYENTK